MKSTQSPPPTRSQEESPSPSSHRLIFMRLFFPLLLSMLLSTKVYSWSPSSCESQQPSRRAMLNTVAAATPFVLVPTVSAAEAPPSFATLLQTMQQAKAQLDPVPKLIEQGKWDSVRAILIEPPLVDCWGKTSSLRPILKQYAEALGDAGGDELEALELREALIGHLRYLDMAVYNNVFNPIATEGENGASKELIKSYYEDPLREYKASLNDLEQLIRLGKEL